ncbi:MAG: type II secretion system protein N [Candidatus Competibacterales bacterium]|nr:type II secretion system protein N [Candidatus Competibacterales bacterium]
MPALRPALRPETLARLILPVNLLLVIALAASLADLTLHLLPTTDRSPPAATAHVAPDQAPVTAGADHARIAGWHLFGSPRPETAPAPPPPAPETRLDLRLAGVFHRAGRPLALIAVGRQPERIFRVGEILADGTRIEQIHPDRVILARQDRQETLSLPRDRAALDSVAATTEVVEPGAVADRLRTRLATDPAATLRDLARATPELRNGRFVGLRLQPGRVPQLFRQLGLRDGDVLTAIDGTPLRDPGHGLALLQSLRDANRVSVRVLRDGTERVLSFALDR